MSHPESPDEVTKARTASGNPLSRKAMWTGSFVVMLAIAGVVLVVLAYFSQFGALAAGREAERAAWGQLGDFIGGTVNPVIGLLTLVGLAVTVWLQTRQLEMSRQALADAQREMHAAATERAEAARLIAEQISVAKAAAGLQSTSATTLAVATEYQILAQAFDSLTKQREIIAARIQEGSIIPSDVPRHRENLMKVDQTRDQLGETILQAALQLLNRRATDTQVPSS